MCFARSTTNSLDQELNNKADPSTASEKWNRHYLDNLIKSLVTVSLRTQRLIADLPKFVVEEEK